MAAIYLFIMAILLSHTSQAKSLNDLLAEQQTQSQQGPDPSSMVGPRGDAPPRALPEQAQRVDLSTMGIVDVLTAAIQEQMQTDIAIKLTQAPGALMCQKKLLEPKIASLNINDRQTNFSAEILVCEDQGPLIMSGTIDVVIEVPALNRVVHLGQTITEQDLTTIKLPQRLVNKMTITHASDLIGCQPRSEMLKMNMPIHTRQVEKALAVRKDSQVNINYVRPKMQLSMKGVALESGRQGDVINILNTTSKKVIKGTVEGEGHVFIPAPLYHIQEDEFDR